MRARVRMHASFKIEKVEKKNLLSGIRALGKEPDPHQGFSQLQKQLLRLTIRDKIEKINSKMVRRFCKHNVTNV